MNDERALQPPHSLHFDRCPRSASVIFVFPDSIGSLASIIYPPSLSLGAEMGELAELWKRTFHLTHHNWEKCSPKAALGWEERSLKGYPVRMQKDPPLPMDVNSNVAYVLGLGTTSLSCNMNMYFLPTPCVLGLDFRMTGLRRKQESRLLFLKVWVIKKYKCVCRWEIGSSGKRSSNADLVSFHLAAQRIRLPVP